MKKIGIAIGAFVSMLFATVAMAVPVQMETLKYAPGATMLHKAPAEDYVLQKRIGTDIASDVPRPASNFYLVTNPTIGRGLAHPSPHSKAKLGPVLGSARALHGTSHEWAFGVVSLGASLVETSSRPANVVVSPAGLSQLESA